MNRTDVGQTTRLMENAMLKRLRVYADTSVVGGCFDPEFKRGSLALMGMVREGSVVLPLSELLGIELRRAPEKVTGIAG